MRYGLIGDIHAEDELLAIALDALADVDAILAVGDLADGRGDLDRCCELLAARGVLAVRGNHDRWFLAHQMRDLPDATLVATPATHAYLAALPPVREVGSVFLCHGLGLDDMARLLPYDEGYALEVNSDLKAVLAAGHAIVVGGHTHRRMIRSFGSTVFVNPGTLHRPHEPGFMLLDDVARTVEVHLFGPGGALSSTRHLLDDRFP